ncbi:MAG: protein TolQ [Gammaproteobacteria bacterium]|nr:protein TolQ [Gammaproteobacteria bacterium]MCW8910393.1 protein TolQ [Gammaproteobacteria bacterium]MCW9004619.1 protein TolQ [Gammaproteobacteria bacterium]MCW9056670.1 protein TolQ [Gammaproteobacteria bacterium]
MSTDLSLITLIAEASLLVKLVMLLLLSASVLSWFVIVRKYKLLKQATEAALKFEDEFWSGADLSELYTSLYRRRLEREGMEKVFETGFSEYARSYKSTKDHAFLMASIQRSMKVALSREEDKLESNLSLLATIGSTSPYIGLFGTVWGIMNSFTALGAVQNASLTMVAPGIAEALIATAMGLFAAIPAVIGYNRFADLVERLVGRYENFAEEFATILQRQSLKHIDSGSVNPEEKSTSKAEGESK